MHLYIQFILKHILVKRTLSNSHLSVEFREPWTVCTMCTMFLEKNPLQRKQKLGNSNAAVQLVSLHSGAISIHGMVYTTIASHVQKDTRMTNAPKMVIALHTLFLCAVMVALCICYAVPLLSPFPSQRASIFGKIDKLICTLGFGAQETRIHTHTLHQFSGFGWLGIQTRKLQTLIHKPKWANSPKQHSLHFWCRKKNALTRKMMI